MEENSNCENENVAAAKADVDDELYPGELYYPEIDGKIACTCFQCGIEYILENNMKGDEIGKHILCSRHLFGGVKMCQMWKADHWTRNL